MLLEPETKFEVLDIITSKGCLTKIVVRAVDSPPILARSLSIFEEKLATYKKQKSKIAYAVLFPDPLNDLINVRHGDTFKTIDEAIRDTGVSNVDAIISRCREAAASKVKELNTMNMTKSEGMALIGYTAEMENKSDNLYRRINRALSHGYSGSSTPSSSSSSSSSAEETSVPKDKSTEVFLFINRSYDEDPCQTSSKGVSDVRDYLFYLLSAIRKIPIHETKYPVYRGVGISVKKDNTFFRTYKKGNEITWRPFTSTSKRRDVALDFSHKHVLFEIYGNFRGHVVSCFSKIPSEDGQFSSRIRLHTIFMLHTFIYRSSYRALHKIQGCGHQAIF